MMRFMFSFFMLLVTLFPLNLYAADSAPAVSSKQTQRVIRGKSTHLPLPRFVTLKYNKTNMRSGPGREYAILWFYQKRGLPVEIINEYEHWRRIRDLDGSEGWLHQSVISGKRMVITLEGTHNVYEDPNLKSDIEAKVDGGIILRPEKCDFNFCAVTHSKFSGWIPKNVIYGVYDHEVF